MFDKWIEVFRAGKHTDAAGNSREWSEADLDKIVSSYDPSKHEAPVVVGHPKDNSPAFAWVESLKREGSVLLAKIKDALPEFTEAVEKKMYKKRSIALYPDLSLRHLGFLGGMPPAVKGLADLSFNEADEFMEFMDWDTMDMATIFANLRDDMIETRGLEVADRLIPASLLDSLKRSAAAEDMVPESCLPVSPSYAEGDEPGATDPDPAADPATDPAPQEEQTPGPDPKDVELSELKTELAAQKRKVLVIELNSFADALVLEGKLPPTMKAGAIEFLELVNGVESFEFEEEGEASALDRFKSFLASMPKRLPDVVNFNEGVDPAEMDSPKEIARKAVEFQASQKAVGIEISVTDAVQHITKKEK